jgi:ATP-dependent protease Clp ATPase subunit
MTDVGRLSESGYVGDDVEHILAGLLEHVGGSVEDAELGVVFLDGIEKLHVRRPLTRARDISGESVQRELLRMLDGATLSVPKSGGSRHPMRTDDITIDTSGILLVASLRMEGWDLPLGAPERALRDALCEAGMLGAFISRFDRIVQLGRLDATQSAAVVAGSIEEARRRAESLGTALEVTPSAAAVLASVAASSPDGAWAVRGPIHRILEDILLLPSAAPAWRVDEADALRLVGIAPR